MVNNFDDIEEPHVEVDADDYESAGEIPNLGEDIVSQLGKRKRTSKVAVKVAMALEVDEAVTPRPREEHVNIPMNNHHEQQEHPTRANGHESGHSAVNGSNGEATSKARGQGQRGKYKSFVVDMKLKGKESKLKIFIPDEIDRAIGENARHLVNECGRVVRTRAPLNVKGWKEAFAKAGNAMWKEIEEKFQIAAGSSSLKMEAFVIDTMQRLYRLWKARLHYYYKSAKCGKTDAERLTNPPPDLPQEQWEYCVKHFSDPEFKKVSERNSKNCLSDKRCTHTTGNLSFAEFEDLLQNNNVKPPADVIWLAEHTHKNEDGVLEWVDQSRSKEIHEKMKDVIATAGDSMTQEEVLLEVFPPRSSYFGGKGTALRGYSKGRQQLQHEEALQKQQ